MVMSDKNASYFQTPKLYSRFFPVVLHYYHYVVAYSKQIAQSQQSVSWPPCEMEVSTVSYV